MFNWLVCSVDCGFVDERLRGCVVTGVGVLWVVCDGCLLGVVELFIVGCLGLITTVVGFGFRSFWVARCLGNVRYCML